MRVTFVLSAALITNLVLSAIHIAMAAAKSPNATVYGPIENNKVPNKRENFFAPYRISGIIWAVIFIAIQAFLCIWSALGLVENTLKAPVVVGFFLIVATQVSLLLPVIRKLFDKLIAPSKTTVRPLLAMIVLLIIAGCLAKFSLEWPSNLGLTFSSGHVLEQALITFALIGVFFLFQRHGSAPAVLVLLVAVLGIAEYFVVLFKAMPIQPGDLFALSTAAAVSEDMQFILSPACLYGISSAALAVLCCLTAGTLRSEFSLLPARKKSYLNRNSTNQHPVPQRPSRKRAAATLAVNLMLGIACIGGIVGHVAINDYTSLGYEISSWNPLSSYRQYGFLTSFIASAQAIIPIQPDNYDSDEAASLLEAYAAQYDSDENTGASEERAAAVAQFEEEQPTVIVIMNESFSDLSIYENLRAGYEGPEFYNSISDALVKGTLYVSTFGGGTCNTEFEFLTGNTMAFIGSGAYPYVTYNLTETENLARQFKELGYTTTAIHPNFATNWNREVVYEDLGFDEFLYNPSFVEADRLRKHVTDEALYDTILELLENDDDPQFIFTVTMQNHSSYTTGLVPEDMQTHYVIDGEEDSEVNEYLSVIQESDRALEEFLAQLEELDREVVVVFFGDHQPGIASRYSEWFDDDDSQSFDELKWETTYMIWANYDVAGNSQTSEQKDISANYLGALLMETIGAPLTDYQKAQIALSEALPVICSAGYKDSTGTWYLDGSASGKDASLAETDDQADAIQALLDLSMIQYYKFFDHDGSVYALRLQSAANF